ncbi:MAG: hypothetical protein GY947_07700 [Rhodobacteraceae bacterium]|nr:hypothetical protein [Paracoccaceae bacterium]
MKKSNSVLSLAAALFLGTSAAVAEDVNGTPENSCSSYSCLLTGVRIGNPLDSSTWWDGSEHAEHDTSQIMEINPFDPEFLMKIPNPKTHSTVHAALANPKTWGQFFKPATYANMVTPEVIVKWVNPETFNVLADPQTYAYWAQPGAYMHVVDLDNYSQLVNWTAYTALVKDVSSHWTAADEG